jgi:hypothetical protein
MGLLDDAIREHLELKRKHGAGDEELRRQETEALGPARRDFATPDPAEEPQAAPVPSDDAAGGYEPERPAAEPATWLDDEPEQPEPVAPTRPEPIEHAAEAAAPARSQEPPPAPDPAPPPITEVPTEGFDALSAGDEDDEPDAGDAEDVLEETPDFLQDTPEHDRLWFEQKPPRDFDFDD